MSNKTNYIKKLSTLFNTNMGLLTKVEKISNSFSPPYYPLSPTFTHPHSLPLSTPIEMIYIIYFFSYLRNISKKYTYFKKKYFS